MLIYDIKPIDYLPEGTWLNCDPEDKDAWSRQTRKVFEAHRVIDLRYNWHKQFTYTKPLPDKILIKAL